MEDYKLDLNITLGSGIRELGKVKTEEEFNGHIWRNWQVECRHLLVTE